MGGASGGDGRDAAFCLLPLQPCAVATSTDVAFEGRGGGFAAITKQHAIYLTINIMLIPLAGTPYCFIL